MEQKDLLAAKAILLSFETMRYGWFMGGLRNKSAWFIGALRSLIKLLPSIIKQCGHRLANLFYRQTNENMQNPFEMRMDDENWVAFDILLVVFNTYQYFQNFMLISKESIFSNFGGLFLEPTSEPWGRYLLGPDFIRFVRALIELFVIPEVYDENGQNCTQNVTVYRYNSTLRAYEMVGVEATYREFNAAISTECRSRDPANNRFRCIAAEKIATTQQIMLLIVNTLPIICLHEPPEEVFPLLIPLLRLAFGRVIYVVDASLQSESSAPNLPSHKDLQPVLFLSIKGSYSTLDNTILPLFIVLLFVGMYLKQWQKSIQLGSRCVLILFCELVFEMCAPFARCNEEESLNSSKGDIEPPDDHISQYICKAYNVLKRHRKIMQPTTDIDQLNFWRAIDHLWPTTPSFDQLAEISKVLGSIMGGAHSHKSGILQFLQQAERLRPKSSNPQQQLIDVFYYGTGFNDHVLSSLHMQVI